MVKENLWVTVQVGCMVLVMTDGEAGEYGQALVDRNEVLESKLKQLGAELKTLQQEAKSDAEETVSGSHVTSSPRQRR